MSIEAISYVKTLELRRARKASLLLYVIGENTFNDTFRCLLGHEQLGYEAGRISVRTVSRHLVLLEEEGRILRRPRFNSDGGRAFDEIEIVGFAEWYTAQHPRRNKGKPDKLSDMPHTPKCPVNLLQPDNVSGGGNRTTLSPPTCQQVSGSIDTRTTPVQVSSPPTPSATRRGREGRIEELISELRSTPQRYAIVDILFAPLLRQRQLSAPAPSYVLGQLADWAGHWDAAIWAAALGRLLHQRHSKVFQSDIREALQACRLEHEKREAARKAAAAEARRAAEDPQSPQRQALADQLVVGSPLGSQALADDWLPELRAWCAEKGALPANKVEIALIIAKRDELLAGWEEDRKLPMTRIAAEGALARRAATIQRLSKLMGIEPPKQEDAA